MAILTSDNKDFDMKTIKRDEEGHPHHNNCGRHYDPINIKGQIDKTETQQEDNRAHTDTRAKQLILSLSS